MNKHAGEAGTDAEGQINQACREFHKLLTQGQSPSIEKYLARFPELGRETLFSKLLELELRYRHVKGFEPNSEEYVNRFPKFEKLIRRAFFEPTMATRDSSLSGSMDGILDASHQTASLQSLRANRIGEYELVRELGRGGMGVVYEARHARTGNLVALKTLPRGHDGQELNADRLHRFRKEFRSLSEINHPNLVGMQTLEVDGAQWFFTMDLIEGKDFLSYVRPQGVLDEGRLRSVLKQLARGVIALHQRGIVHRDLKPSNVLVEHDGTVKVLDFGLVAELQQVTDQTASRSAMFAGTPRYAAPEQMYGQRAEGSDWYAVGIMIYEALTGEVPFSTKNPMELLRLKQEQDAPGLAERADLPGDLTQLTAALLRRELAARPLAGAIAEQLHLECETRTAGSTGMAGSAGSSGSMADDGELNFLDNQEEELVLIGREEQLAQLEAARQELLANRQPVVVWVTGLSGEGKSSLVEKFLRPLRNGQEMLVLSGRCYDRESVPFKAIDSLIEPLVRFLRSATPEQLQAWIPDDVAMLAHLFPLLRRVSLIAVRCGNRPLAIDSKQLRYRAFAALRDLLVNLSRTIPLVLFVDDLQWGDGDSAEGLIELLQPPGPPAVLFLGSYRRDEAEESPFLRSWKKSFGEKPPPFLQRLVEVHPLPPEQCLTLVSLRVGIDPSAVKEQASDLFADTQGNPYFLEQLIEGFDAASGSFRAVPLNEIIATKLKRLPATAVQLLHVIAVAGKAVPLSEVSQVAGRDKPAFETITHMRSERLVRLVGAGNEQLVDTFHDKIREVISDNLDESRRIQLHRSYGMLIESQFNARETLEGQFANNPQASELVEIHPRVPDLAYHFTQACDRERAFRYSLRAGTQAMAAYAFADAMKFLENAKSFESPDVSQRDRFQLSFLRGKGSSGIGHLDKCIELLQEAITLAMDAKDRAAAYFELAEALFRRGDYNAAIKSFSKCFAELGEKLPRTIAGKVVLVCKNVISMHIVPRSILRVVTRRKEEDSVQLARLFPRYSQMISHLDVLALFYGAVRACAIAKTTNAFSEIRVAYGYYAVILGLSGIPLVARRVMVAARRINADSCRGTLQGAMHYHEGGFDFCFGKLMEAEVELRMAEFLLRKTDDFRHLMAVHFLRHVWSVRGNAIKIAGYASKEYEIAHQSNNEIAMAYGNYGLADAFSRRGQFNEGVRAGESAAAVLEKWNGAFTSLAYQELGRARLQASEYDAARISLDRAVALILRLGFFEISVPTFPLLVEALLGSVWASNPRIVSARNRRLARRMAWIARMTGWLFPNNRPHALRASGRVAAARGKKLKALKYFDQANAAALKIGADYEAARALLDKSMLDHPQGVADRQRGLELLETLGCVLPDAEVEYLGFDRAAHHARAAEAHARHEDDLEAAR